jgi:hypothetical protein
MRDGKRVLLHRYVYEECNGAIPEGMIVMHTCDNPACMNIEHLRLGTVEENIADRQAKHRQCRGEMVRDAKLTEEQVREIRQLRRGGAMLKEIAAAYGVSDSHVAAIDKRRKWAWLP